MDKFIQEFNKWGITPFTGRGCYLKNKSLYNKIIKGKEDVLSFIKLFDDYNYDYTRGHTDLLSTCSYIDEYDHTQYGLGTPEALKQAVTDGDAVFVYRDDLLNFSKFVKEKLNVDVV